MVAIKSDTDQSRNIESNVKKQTTCRRVLLSKLLFYYIVEILLEDISHTFVL